MENSKLLVKPPPQQMLVSATTDETKLLAVGKIAPHQPNTSWVAIPLRAVGDGQARLTLSFSGGTTQVINYRTMPAFNQHLDTYSKFQSTKAFFSDPDPFQRSPSVMPYDRELKKHVLDDPRNFIVGLSDDAGAGANVGFASKQRFRPVQSELTKLDDYIQHTLWGEEMDGAGVMTSLQDHSTFGIRSSMFWVPLPSTNETGMPGYNYTKSDSTGWIWDWAR